MASIPTFGDLPVIVHELVFFIIPMPELSIVMVELVLSGMV